MPPDIIYFIIYLACIVTTILGSEICFVKEKSKNFPINITTIYHCKSQQYECCDQGCCLIKDPLEFTKWGSSGSMSPFVWFLVSLIAFGYFYFFGRYCYKKLTKKKRQTERSFSRVSTQPQEVNLMLSFNQHRDGLERFNFEGINNAHIHVPFMPATPITPPPAYMTLTPPPTYNVAIHFPSIQSVPKLETQEEKDETAA